MEGRDRCLTQGKYAPQTRSTPSSPPAGAVLPPSASLYVAADPLAFRARPASPRGGEGLLVVHAKDRGDLFNSGSWTVKDGAGNTVSSSRV